MRDCLINESLRKKLILEGNHQLSKFNWEKASQEYLKLIKGEGIRICPTVKVVAMYLPQYHETKENSQVLGKGFYRLGYSTESDIAF